MDNIVLDTRRRRNAESLVLEASGKEQAPKLKAASPATLLPDAVPAAPATPPVGSPRGPDNPKKGKGKGKGKSAPDDAVTEFSIDQYQGTAINDIPEDQRCCIFHLYVDKDGVYCCKSVK